MCTRAMMHVVRKGSRKGICSLRAIIILQLAYLVGGNPTDQKVALTQRGYQIIDVLEISELDCDAVLSIVSQMQLVDKLLHLVMRE